MKSEILLVVMMAAAVGCRDARDEAVVESARESIGAAPEERADTADWVANRAPVPRCHRHLDDHSRTGGDHGGRSSAIWWRDSRAL
jgi:hypothetical protein